MIHHCNIGIQYFVPSRLGMLFIVFIGGPIYCEELINN